MNSEGRIELPIEVRKRLGLRPGDSVQFEEGESGEYILRPKAGSLMALKGFER
jgi:AbrB family looped-hinge helix DNA binding protein